MVGDFTLNPWQQHLIDWTRFAVIIRESELPILLEILSAIPYHQVCSLLLFDITLVSLPESSLQNSWRNWKWAGKS